MPHWSSCSATSCRPTARRGSAVRGAFCATPWPSCATSSGVSLTASFEHEFQLSAEEPPALAFSLEAQRRAEPFAGEVMGALAAAGVQPERFFAEFAAHQFEIPVHPAEGLAAADRTVVLREVVRDVARRHELRASFAPLLDPAEAGQRRAHPSQPARRIRASALYDAARPACLSELGERFAAGILLHARALTALTAPSPVSAARLAPHHWSAGAVCLGAAQPRDAAAHPAARLARRGRSGPSSTDGSRPAAPGVPRRRRDRQPLPRARRDRPRGARRGARRAARAADPRPRSRLSSTPPRPPATASARCRRRSRSRCEALAEDDTARGVDDAAAVRGVRRPSSAPSSRRRRTWTSSEVCRRYAAIY